MMFAHTRSGAIYCALLFNVQKRAMNRAATDGAEFKSGAKY